MQHRLPLAADLVVVVLLVAAFPAIRPDAAAHPLPDADVVILVPVGLAGDRSTGKWRAGEPIRVALEKSRSIVTHAAVQPCSQPSPVRMSVVRPRGVVGGGGVGG